MKRGLTRALARVAAILGCLAPCLAAADPSVVGYELVSSARVGRTAFDYTYRLKVQNASPAYWDLTYTAVSTDPATVVLDGVVRVGDVFATTSTISTDTFTIRQERLQAFNPAVLRWSFAGRSAFLIEGNRTSLAALLVRNFSTNDVIDSSELISVTERVPFKVARTKSYIRFLPGATVEQVNRALLRVHASITRSLEGHRGLVIRFPDAGSESGLRAVLDALRSQPGIESADYALVGDLQPQRLPTDYQARWGTTIDWRLADLVAAKAPAVWNLVRPLYTQETRPTLIVVDTFGNGGPGIGLATDAVNPSFETRIPSLPPDQHIHGYGVLSRVLFDFGGVGAAGTTDREVAAAIAPFQPTDFPQDRVKVVPLEYHSDTQTFLQDIIEAARNSVRDESHHRVVLNISMGICPIVDDKTDEVISRCSELPPSAVTARLALGREWLRLLRGEDDWWSARTAADPESLESRLLITASAGNDSSDKAFLNAPWTSAALPAAELGFGPGGDPVEHALNTLVVESREVQQAMVDGALVYGPGCRSWFSTHDGNIAAFGESARPFGVLVASDGAGGTRDAFGTSFAAPQVASLAMYLWSIAPELKAPDVKSRIVGTSRADCSNQMPVIDAYRAALSIDGPITGSALDAPVRRGLLDIDGSEVFDRADLDIFISAFQTSNGALRYSRADLNGDARTGGDYKEIFDLNGDGALSVVSVPNHARDASIDERSGVTDAQVLCYYAFSWLTLNGSDLAALKSGLGAEPACDGTPDVPLLRYTSITYTALPFHDPVVDFNDQGHILVQNVNTVFAVNNSDQVIGCNNGWGFLDNASPSILLTGGSPDVGHDHGCFLDINNHGVIAGASASGGILWQNGTESVISLHGMATRAVVRINDQGDMIVMSSDWHAVSIIDGVETDLGEPAANVLDNYRLNSQGLILDRAAKGIWRAGQFQPLQQPACPGIPSSSVGTLQQLKLIDMNDAGDIVGGATCVYAVTVAGNTYSISQTHAVVYRNGVPHFFTDPFGFLAQYEYGIAINNLGAIAISYPGAFIRVYTPEAN